MPSGSDKVPIYYIVTVRFARRCSEMDTFFICQRIELINKNLKIN